MLTTEKFIIAMDEAGIKLKDRIYWIKSCSQPGDNDGSLGNVELLLKFSFCKNPYVDYTWLNDIAQKEDLKYGEGQRVRLSSFLNLKDGIVKTNIANTARLRAECKKHGFYLEHTSTYPIEIPYIFLMTSCREGSHFVDLYNGTGTSGKAALIINSEFKKNIVYHGFEINSLSVHSTKVNIEMDLGEQPSDNIIPFYPKQDNEIEKAA
jgi:DNA modification methylase